MKLNNDFPDMSLEILESIHNNFKDDLDVEVDCLLFLTKLENNSKLCKKLSNRSIDILEKMNRCEICGSPLELYFYNEPHPELDGCPMEEMTEVYCPNCDMNVGG